MIIGNCPREVPWVSLISLGNSIGKIIPDKSCGFSTVCPTVGSPPKWWPDRGLPLHTLLIERPFPPRPGRPGTRLSTWSPHSRLCSVWQALLHQALLWALCTQSNIWPGANLGLILTGVLCYCTLPDMGTQWPDNRRGIVWPSVTAFSRGGGIFCVQ